ncbi:NUDIX domain-containing protein [Aquabacter cavernae]|uniref:NUDIX domain-containing protein n=1 Tax=Aquabacter cavernae TaxID=2496029 RepID=UPI000F8E7EEB|nr:NUDIX hydrolase [Aquabacter cavernae]
MSSDGPKGDAPADVVLGAPKVLADAFLGYETYEIHLSHPGGGQSVLKRDVVRMGPVVGILCVDPAAGCVVLIRQFRLSAHFATGRGDMIELPAGRVEAGEDIEAAARRECAEETGLTPLRMRRMFDVMPSPGVLDEYGTLYLADVESTLLPERAGLADENEVTHPFALPLDDAFRLLEEGRCYNGYLVMALQWLALNRATLGL